LKQLGIKEKN